MTREDFQQHFQSHPWTGSEDDKVLFLSHAYQKVFDFSIQTEHGLTAFLVYAYETWTENQAVRDLLLSALTHHQLALNSSEWIRLASLSLEQEDGYLFEHVMQHTPQNSQVAMDELIQCMVQHPKLIAENFDTLLRHSQTVSRHFSALHNALLAQAPHWKLSLQEAEVVQKSWSLLRYRPKLSSFILLQVWANSTPEEPPHPVSSYVRYALSGLIQMELEILQCAGGWPQMVYTDSVYPHFPKDCVRIDDWIRRHPIWQDAFDSTLFDKLQLEDALPRIDVGKNTPRL